MNPTIVPLWGTEDVAAYLGVPVRTLDEWAYKGLGPVYSRVGRYRRYRPADVEAFLDATRCRPRRGLTEPPPRARLRY